MPREKWMEAFVGAAGEVQTGAAAGAIDRTKMLTKEEYLRLKQQVQEEADYMELTDFDKQTVAGVFKGWGKDIPIEEIPTRMRKTMYNSLMSVGALTQAKKTEVAERRIGLQEEKFYTGMNQRQREFWADQIETIRKGSFKEPLHKILKNDKLRLRFKKELFFSAGSIPENMKEPPVTEEQKSKLLKKGWKAEEIMGVFKRPGAKYVVGQIIPLADGRQAIVKSIDPNDPDNPEVEIYEGP